MKSKVLITGSAGFIFSNFIRQSFHTKQNYNIVSIDKVRKSHVLHNIYVNKNHEFYIGDVADEHFMNVIFEAQRPQVVIHAAADTSKLENSLDLLKTNVIGTQIVIDACLKWGVKKLIYISSANVYGSQKTDYDPLFIEEYPLNPTTQYGVSKVAAENLIKSAHYTKGLQYVIARLSNNYGPWQTKERFIPNIIKNIFNNTKTQLYGDGMHLREWTHVYDTCNALFKIINECEMNTEYNISSNHEFTNLEVFQRVCNALGRGHDLLEFIEDKVGNEYRHSIDNSKLKGLGWAPEYKFNNGVSETLQWYLNNPWILKL